jgi:cation diffusion facilitator family transporter
LKADDADKDFNRDYNLRGAFVHVAADAAVSVLVIVGLLAGRQFGWIWMDPVMGLAATVVILNWSFSLGRSAGAVLVDATPDPALSRKIAAQLEENGDLVSDLHLWRMGPGHLAAIVSLVSDHPNPPSFYKKRLSAFSALSHVTVEVEPCPGAHGRANGC